MIRQSWGQGNDWTLHQFANIFSVILRTNLFTKDKKQCFLTLLYQISAFTSFLSRPPNVNAYKGGLRTTLSHLLSKCIFYLYLWMLIYTHTNWERECILLAYPIELRMSRLMNPSLRKKQLKFPSDTLKDTPTAYIRLHGLSLNIL